MVYTSWGFVFDYERKSFFTKTRIGQCLHRKAQEIMTFFEITEQFLDESFSFSNSTKISMRQFYAQIFMRIGSYFQELSYKRSDGHTDRFYSVLTSWLHKKRMLERARRIALKPAPALVWVKQFFISGSGSEFETHLKLVDLKGMRNA